MANSFVLWNGLWICRLNGLLLITFYCGGRWFNGDFMFIVAYGAESADYSLCCLSKWRTGRLRNKQAGMWIERQTNRPSPFWTYSNHHPMSYHSLPDPIGICSHCLNSLHNDDQQVYHQQVDEFLKIDSVFHLMPKITTLRDRKSVV